MNLDSVCVLMTNAHAYGGGQSSGLFIVDRHTAIQEGVTVWEANSFDTQSHLVIL